MRKWANSGLNGLAVAGACVGAVVASESNTGRLVNALAGLCIGWMIALTLPHLVRQPQDDQPRTGDNERTLTFWAATLHPISRPVGVAGLWVVAFEAVVLLTGQSFHRGVLAPMQLPFVAGIGLSGLLMVVRDENIVWKTRKIVLIRGALSKVLGMTNIAMSCGLLLWWILIGLGVF